VSAGAATDTERPVRSITTGPHGFEGEGFPVVRAFAGVSAADLDPFVHMDQMGEVEYEPGQPRGTDWHPHRGFETVTYMIDGRFAHQDSHGGGGLITDGATQWMTAGAGILHIETPPAELVESGGLFHGVQLWVNLPRAEKFTAPAYQAIEGSAVTLLSSTDGGALLRVIAGDIDGRVGPGSTRTPITLAHATLQPGAHLNLRGIASTTPWSTCSPAGGPWARRVIRSTRASLRCLGPVTASTSRPIGRRSHDIQPWTFYFWAASQFASLSSSTGHSS
jgi:redox-sensitive bicupin YhaK (pirin superfamily)